MSDLAQRIAALSPEKLALLERRLNKSIHPEALQPNGGVVPRQQEARSGPADELDKLAAVLRQHPAVAEAALVVREVGHGERRPVAYLVPDRQQARPVWRLLCFDNEDRLSGQPHYDLPNGMVIIHLNRSETDYVYREIFEEQSYLKHGIRLPQGACIFDVGAHIGLFTLFVNRVCPDAEIYAFEPIPPIFSVLQLNTALHDVNVKLFNIGIADKADNVTFSYYPHASVLSGRYADPAIEHQTVKASLQTQQQLGVGEPALLDAEIDELLQARLTTERFTVPVRTLAQVLCEHSVEKITLLKIDVEKSELDVLAGLAEEDWPKIEQIVVEVHDIDGRLQRITELLQGHGYKLTVEQDAMLRETGLYNVYAVRAAIVENPARTETPVASQSAQLWSSPERLVEDVRQFVSERLPERLWPVAFVLLDAMPLTNDGQVLHAALPPPDRIKQRRKEEFVAPRTPTEEKLASIWAEVLGREQVGIHDNFFALNGQWFQALTVIARVRDIFHLDVPLRVLFEEPTVASFAALVLGNQTAAQESRAGNSSSAYHDQLLSQVDRLADEDVSAYLDHLATEAAATEAVAERAPLIAATLIPTEPAEQQVADLTKIERYAEKELLPHLSQLSDEDVDALLFSMFTTEELLRAHAESDFTLAADRAVGETAARPTSTYDAPARFGVDARWRETKPANLTVSTADIQQLFEQIQFAYVQALQEAWMTSQRLAEEAHVAYSQSVQASWQQIEAQGLSLVAVGRNYEEALQATQRATQERYAESYLAYLQALQEAWRQAEVETMPPGVLMAVSYGMALAANFAAHTLGWSGRAAWPH